MSPVSMIYMDHHATTPVDPRVVEAMLPYFTQKFGNAGSTSHAFGHEAAEAVDAARSNIADAIGADPREIVFTSGATESNNLALRGLADRPRRRGNRLISVRTEHRAVLDPLERLTQRGLEVQLLDVDQAPSPRAGWLDPDRVAQSLDDNTLAASVMLANNEIGVIQPIAEIASVCHARGVLLHCDATQAVGRIPIDVRTLDVDLMSFSAHKFYGPKGVGALYVRRRPLVRLVPQIDGGGQEHGLRSGTLNVPGIVGMAHALRLAVSELSSETPRLRALRDTLAAGLLAGLSGVRVNGPALELDVLRLPGNLNMSFDYVDGEALMMSMGELAVSSGSACTSANPEPSHVLRALGLGDDQTRASLRFGLGRWNTPDEVARAVRLVIETVERLRQLSSLGQAG